MRKAEADRLAALKEAEDARREANSARAEQQRLAKLAAEVAATREPTTVVAALPPAEQAPAVAKQADDPLANQVKLARALQTELKRVGCDPGKIDGVWGDRAMAALAQFARIAKVMVPSDVPSSEALQAVLGQKSRICPLGFDVNRQARPKSQETPDTRAGHDLPDPLLRGIR
jgi:peptidoglycan hydrolase-like protein with peptidoglycan-binding domain